MLIDPAKIRMPFLSRDEIQKRVDAFRAEFIRNASLPVDILSVAEFELGLELRPIHKLRASADIEAALLNHRVMALDQEYFMDDRFQNRLRFSVAHEVGHYWLHADLYKEIAFESVENWVAFVDALPEKEHSALEFQAHEFAGRLLVPQVELKTIFDTEWGGKKSAVKDSGLDVQVAAEQILSYIAEPISRRFGVSNEVVVRRIKADQLFP